jgi:uncharacterized protein (DUF2141 family)
MKTVITTALLMISHLAMSQSGTLTVVIQDVKGTKGKVAIALYNDAKVFLKAKFKLDSRSVVAQNGEVTLQFENLPAGDYAVSVMHDENENGELDSNFVGIPTEGFGFSNDAKAMFGPPSYDKCVFQHAAAQRISIHMKYL